jgi:hypothetical protein
MLERVHASEGNPSGCAIWYKRNDQITWANGGANETGQYLARPQYSGAEVPSDLMSHWWQASDLTCSLTTI